MQDEHKAVHLSKEEEAAIAEMAWDDWADQPLTDEELDQFVPWAERYSRHFPLQMWCDRDVVDAFQAGGPGWQRRMNEALRDWARQHDLLPRA